MFKWFGKKFSEGELVSPVTGTVVPLAQVPDPVFAGGSLGQGVAVIPEDGKFYAPFEGTVETVFKTKHVLILKSTDNVELMIHIGIDTVTLEGKPFHLSVEQSQKVHKGDLLVKADLEAIKNADLSSITPLIITNSSEFSKIELTDEKKLFALTSKLFRLKYPIK